MFKSNDQLDFVSNDLCTTWPPGMEVEVFKASALADSSLRCIDSEIREGLYKPNTYQVLSQEFQNLKLKVKSEIHKELMSGNKIAAYGASASSTVLSYLLDINPHLSYIVDDNEFRQERLSPGYMIPIKSSSSLLVDQPSIVIITAWRFAEKIIDNNQSYLDAGGTFIVPLPNFEVISHANRRTAI